MQAKGVTLELQHTRHRPEGIVLVQTAGKLWCFSQGSNFGRLKSTSLQPSAR